MDYGSQRGYDSLKNYGSLGYDNRRDYGTWSIDIHRSVPSSGEIGTPQLAVDPRDGSLHVVIPVRYQIIRVATKVSEKFIIVWELKERPIGDRESSV